MVEKDTNIRGSCLCRAVAYAVADRPGPMWHCHCVICRKLSGAAFATHMAARASDFFWLCGQELLTHFELSATLVRSFCRQCGSVVPYTTSDGTWMVVPAGGLDDDPGVKPGGVVYEVRGTLDVIKNCHCWRDRKMTGAPHDSCLLAATSALHWLQGEALVVVYSLPEAPGFRTGFCQVCGTSLPAMVPHATSLGIPAGALDNDPGARARYHIFCGAKAPWFEITDDLPQFAEYPPPGFDWRQHCVLG